MKGARGWLAGAVAVTLAGTGGLPRAAQPETASAKPAETIELKDAPGRDLTIGRCNICHSLDYIPSNAPAMDRGAWQKSIQKMRERFGAPITDEEATQILDYLDRGYSGKS